MRDHSYASFILRSHRGLAIFSAAVAGTLQYFIIWLFATLDYGPIIPQALERIPSIIRGILGEEFFARFSLEGLAAFGFEHPLVLALFALNCILIPARHISGEAESGTLELLLSHPVRRTRLLLTLWLCSSFLLLLIVSGACAGSLIAISLFHNLTPKLLVRILQIGANLWLFSIFVTTFTLLLSTFGKEGSKTGIVSAGITLVSYFLHYLSKLWDAIAFTKPFNMFTYYQPQMLMFGHETFSRHIIILLVLTGMCLALSILQFRRRDIPG